MKRSLQLVALVGLPLLLLGFTFNSVSRGSPGARQTVEVTPLPPVDDGDGRAGVCFSYYPGDPDRPYLPLVRNAGSRWDRFDFIWPNIEASENSWHFDGYDDLVQDMSDMGINTVGILLWTPDWAASRSGLRPSSARPPERPRAWFAPSVLSPQAPSALSPSPPMGLYEAWDDWTTTDGDPINYWGRYVHTVVSRYSDPSRFDRPVRHWEVWNEVDDGPWDYFWRGSEADYAQLLKVAYQATKAACSSCKVLHAGLLFWADQQYFERVLDIVNDDPDAVDNNHYFDVMSVHLYSRSSTTLETIERIRSRMKQYVGDHPIWLTETGVMVWDDGAVDPDPRKYDYAATQREAASYVIQSYANAWASDVERYFFFRANDQDMSEYFGLMRNDRSFRPSYVAYQVAAKHLVTPTMVTTWLYGGGIRRVTLWGTPRGKVSVIWNTTPDLLTFDYEATLPTARLIDQRGQERTIAPADGAYELALPGATANRVEDPSDYFIGGEPFILIEEDTASPSQVTVAQLPTVTYSSTVQVSWSASDDQAGVWGVELQVQERGQGTWEDWLGLANTAGLGSAGYEGGEDDSTYCFRARAWDRAGNQGPWSDGEACTTLSLRRDVHLAVEAVFGDEDGDGHQSYEEPALSDVAFRLVNPTGQDEANPSLGASWEYAGTLLAGEYVLLITPQKWPAPPPGWFPRRVRVDIPPGETTWDLDLPSVGLLRHRSSSFIPRVVRGG